MDEPDKVCWPIDQEINQILLACDGGDDFEYVTVGRNGVTRIEKTQKGGEYCLIPYLRVWCSDSSVMEICQHKVHSIVYAPKEP